MHDYKIRKATGEDIADIVALCEPFWQRTIYQHIPFDHETVEDFVKDCLDGLLIVLCFQDNVVGFFAGIIGPMLANENYMQCSDVGFYITPFHRKKGIGRELLAFAMDEAKREQCDYFNMGFMYSSMPQAVEHLYQSMGLEPVEKTYTKRLI